MTKEIALAIYCLCFADGAVAHLLDFVRGGWFPYHLGPPPMRLLWTLLIVLDSTVIVLLLIGWHRTGLLLAVGIMLADAAANSYAAFVLHYRGFEVALPLQSVFLGFILGSVGFLWQSQIEPA